MRLQTAAKEIAPPIELGLFILYCRVFAQPDWQFPALHAARDKTQDRETEKRCATLQFPARRRDYAARARTPSAPECRFRRRAFRQEAARPQSADAGSAANNECRGSEQKIPRAKSLSQDPL